MMETPPTPAWWERDGRQGRLNL